MPAANRSYDAPIQPTEHLTLDIFAAEPRCFVPGGAVLVATSKNWTDGAGGNHAEPSGILPCV
jgi:hypothetical protein